jgi:hypothetical protein
VQQQSIGYLQSNMKQIHKEKSCQSQSKLL